VWRELRDELHPDGFELLTVALDATGGERSRRWIEAAAPTHPTLIDGGHALDRRFGVVNVPSGIWIDEAGMVVRPPEPAFPGPPAFAAAPLPDDLDPYQREVMLESRRIRIQPRRYVNALRSWVQGSSENVLSAEAVEERAGRVSPAAALAAAHFELGAFLQGSGRPDGAVRHFREALRLQPENWTYRRQAWSLADRFQGPSEVYPGDWLSAVREIGAENYYPPLDL